jgi:hypothetical protein
MGSTHHVFVSACLAVLMAGLPIPGIAAGAATGGERTPAHLPQRVDHGAPGQGRLVLPDPPAGAARRPAARSSAQTPPATSSRSRGAWKWILVGAGGAAAAVVIATRSGSSSGSTTPAGTVTIGAPVVGAPQ